MKVFQRDLGMINLKEFYFLKTKVDEKILPIKLFPSCFFSYFAFVVTMLYVYLKTPLPKI